MKLEDLERHWQAFGEQDPLWAILSLAGKRGRGWDVDEFLATGRAEVGFVMDRLAEHAIEVDRNRALDFGCGVGRLTLLLADHFTRCDGIDLARSMIEQARTLNRLGDRVRYHHSAAQDLRMFSTSSFDFVLALLVLQHMEATLMRGYLGEFVRLLRPRGVCYFNIPEPSVTGEPLPPEAWRAGLELRGAMPRFASGEPAVLEVLVRNDSPVPWPAEARLSVGNHWRTFSGKMLAVDDVRAQLDGGLAPGEQTLVRVPLAPPGGDAYLLEIDLVQEHVGWFGERGSPTLCIPVLHGRSRGDLREANSALRVARPGRGKFTPWMEMHALPREQVVATVEAAGGGVVAAFPVDRCGPVWPSVDYIVRRRDQAQRT
jgi:SAM-dependent methyltransferase